MQLSASVIASNSIARHVCFGNSASAVRPPLADIQGNVLGNEYILTLASGPLNSTEGELSLPPTVAS